MRKMPSFNVTQMLLLKSRTLTQDPSDAYDLTGFYRVVSRILDMSWE